MMKRIWFLAVGVIVIALVTFFGVASADTPLTYDVYTVGQYTCVDFGAWGQCLCPCDATDCNATLVGNQPPGIGGGPAADDWIEVTATPTDTVEPIPTHRPEGEPTDTPPPTLIVPTREQPPVVSTPVPRLCGDTLTAVTTVPTRLNVTLIEFAAIVVSDVVVYGSASDD